MTLVVYTDLQLFITLHNGHLHVFCTCLENLWSKIRLCGIMDITRSTKYSRRKVISLTSSNALITSLMTSVSDSMFTALYFFSRNSRTVFADLPMAFAYLNKMSRFMLFFRVLLFPAKRLVLESLPSRHGRFLRGLSDTDAEFHQNQNP